VFDNIFTCTGSFVTLSSKFSVIGFKEFFSQGISHIDLSVTYGLDEQGSIPGMGRFSSFPPRPD
jgi:hypothetical protein